MAVTGEKEYQEPQGLRIVEPEPAASTPAEAGSIWFGFQDGHALFRVTAVEGDIPAVIQVVNANGAAVAAYTAGPPVGQTRGAPQGYSQQYHYNSNGYD